MSDGYSLPNSSDCSATTWLLDDSSCNAPEIYTGSVCRTYLLAWQNCAIGPKQSDALAINATTDQADMEQLVIQIFEALGQCLFACCCNSYLNLSLIHYDYYLLNLIMLINQIIKTY